MKHTITAVALLLGSTIAAASGGEISRKLNALRIEQQNILLPKIVAETHLIKTDNKSFRQYSWTPPDNPKVTCFVVIAGGAGCYSKAVK